MGAFMRISTVWLADGTKTNWDAAEKALTEFTCPPEGFPAGHDLSESFLEEQILDLLESENATTNAARKVQVDAIVRPALERVRQAIEDGSSEIGEIHHAGWRVYASGGLTHSDEPTDFAEAVGNLEGTGILEAAGFNSGPGTNGPGQATGSAVNGSPEEEDGVEDSHRSWMFLHFGQLEGATITRFKIGKDEGRPELYPVFDLTLADGREIELQAWRDEDGNGPGHLAGIPTSPAERADETCRNLALAQAALKGHDGQLWHSGGGIVLIAAFEGEMRITAAPDENNLGKFAIEVAPEKGGDSIVLVQGLTLDELVEEWDRQIGKHRR